MSMTLIFTEQQFKSKQVNKCSLKGGGKPMLWSIQTVKSCIEKRRCYRGNINCDSMYNECMVCFSYALSLGVVSEELKQRGRTLSQQEKQEKQNLHKQKPTCFDGERKCTCSPRQAKSTGYIRCLLCIVATAERQIHSIEVQFC